MTAGYAPKSRNAFFCFIRKETSRDALNILLAHELFHYWLPNSIKIAQNSEYPDIRYEWFYEGFVDFFAQKVLLEAGLLTPEKYVELFNRNIIDIADNPHRSETFEQFVAAAKEGRFDGRYKRLSYYRGALIARNWNSEIRRKWPKRSMSEFIGELYRLAGKRDKEVSGRAFFDLAKGYGIDAQAEFERHIIRGERIPVLAEEEGMKGFRFSEVEYPLFDPGFSVETTQRTKLVSDVVEGSAAYRAGLRNGMQLVSMRNANRSSNSWRPDVPITIVVKIGEEQRTFEYLPHGRREIIRQFVPSSK